VRGSRGKTAASGGEIPAPLRAGSLTGEAGGEEGEVWNGGEKNSTSSEERSKRVPVASGKRKKMKPARKKDEEGEGGRKQRGKSRGNFCRK